MSERLKTLGEMGKNVDKQCFHNAFYRLKIQISLFEPYLDCRLPKL